MIKIITMTLMTGFLALHLTAQSTDEKWILGIGLNAVDDDGKPMKEFVNLGNGWNALPFPSNYSIQYYAMPALSVGFNYSLNSYSAGHQYDGNKLKRAVLFMATDLNASYHFNTLYNKLMWLDPQIILGVGATLRAKNYAPTGNVGGGLTFWIGDKFGVNLSTMAKFSFTSPDGSNYLQHSLGMYIRMK